MKPGERVLAIDPGTTESGYVIFDGKAIHGKGIIDNVDLVSRIGGSSFSDCAYMVIEMIACYGMPVGHETFDTCVWIGRLMQEWDSGASMHKATQMFRKDVKLHLCNSMRAKDPNIRQALLDRFPKTGGGTRPAIGTKAQPGPLYKIADHMWAALAIACTYYDKEAF